MTRKASLVAAAAQLPAAIEDVKEGTLAPGYVANVTADAVFVRFLGSLTGRAGLLTHLNLNPFFFLIPCLMLHLRGCASKEPQRAVNITLLHGLEN